MKTDKLEIFLHNFVRRPFGNSLQHIILITIEYYISTYTIYMDGHIQTHTHTHTRSNIPATILYHLFALNIYIWNISIWPMLRLFEFLFETERNTHTNNNTVFDLLLLLFERIVTAEMKIEKGFRPRSLTVEIKEIKS